MSPDKITLRLISLTIMAILLYILFIIAGCGPSREEQKVKIDLERTENIRKAQEKEKIQIEEIEAKFNAIYFPPQNLTSKSFTYDIQKFFGTHSRNTIIFKGYLEDIEVNNGVIIAEFICPIGNNYILDKMAINFRLTVPESKMDELLKTKQQEHYLRAVRFIISGPDYYVTSKINKIQKMRKYESNGTANDEEVEIETDVSNRLVAIGQLVEAVNVPKKDKSRK